MSANVFPRATRRFAIACLVFAAIFAVSLLGILTRPSGHLAVFWPANALLLGLMLRFPSLAMTSGWLGGAIGYVAAEVVTGSTARTALLLATSNLIGAFIGYLLLSRLQVDDLRMRRPLSVPRITLMVAAASAVSGVVSAVADPVLFGGDPLRGWIFGFVREWVNYLAILPMMMVFPNWPWRLPVQQRYWAHPRTAIGHMVPGIAFGASCFASAFIDGPGALMTPIPVLLWCALYYSVFTTTVLTFLFSAWVLIALPLGYADLQLIDINSLSMLMSTRIGIALVALAPITVACVVESRNQLLQSIPAIAWVAGADGTLERFNSQWEAYTGSCSEEALGKGWAKAVHPDDLPHTTAAWDTALKGVEPWQVEYRLRGADGHYRWFLARAAPQLDATRRILKWFGTTTDIEDMRCAAQTLKEVDRRKNEFLATLAHELRNPLAPMSFAVDIVSSPTCSPAVRAKSLEMITRQIRQISHLLDDLSDVSRITERRMALRKIPISIGEAIDAAVETARPLINCKSHKVTVEIEQPTPVVMMDPVRLAQIATNLLTNATKYTDSGGKILVTAHSANDMCILRVTDNGIGLAPDAIASIFEMFFQAPSALERAHGGLGIGLALVKGLVELHGGRISASSPGLGKGSVFEVALPLALTEMRPNEMGVASTQAVRTAGRIVLLADDNADALYAMAELLQMVGHTVHLANDGVQAVEIAANVAPEVVILDISMPGFSGYETAQRIRDNAATANCLLVAATGWSQEADRNRALSSGFDIHLTKPLEPGALLDLIAKGRRGIAESAQ